MRSYLNLTTGISEFTSFFSIQCPESQNPRNLNFNENQTHESFLGGAHFKTKCKLLVGVSFFIQCI